MSNTRFGTFEPDGTCTVDAEILAPALGLSAPVLIDELRAARVFQTSERGIGADEGLMRLTFRYRNREFSAVINRAGELVQPAGANIAAIPEASCA